jgi:hypothetical protein
MSDTQLTQSTLREKIMTQQISCANQEFNKTISTEQLNQIVEAILAGKYSWACVLLLRCSGYNPLHYIPYRTYNRLTKENCQIGNTSDTESTKAYHINSSQNNSSRASGNHLTLISDLPYVEELTEKTQSLKGGNLGVFEPHSQIKWLPKFTGFFGCNR